MISCVQEQLDVAGVFAADRGESTAKKACCIVGYEGLADIFEGVVKTPDCSK